jgi:hypothetical protein
MHISFFYKYNFLPTSYIIFYFFENFQTWKKNPFFIIFSFSSSFSFLSLLFSFLLHAFFLTQAQGPNREQLQGAAGIESPPLVAAPPTATAPPHGAPLSPSPSPCLPSSVSSPAMELQLRPWLPSHEEPQSSSFIFVGWPKQMCTTILLPSPPSILSEMNSNLRILLDFVFQQNSDFISNSNLNPSELLLRPYISLGAPPPCLPMSILPQNQTLAATQVPPRRRCLSPPPPLFQSPPFKLNPMPVMKSQGPNHRRKNHVKSWFVASSIYRWSLTIVSHQDCDFSGVHGVNTTSPMSSPCCTLAPRLYRSEIGGL